MIQISILLRAVFLCFILASCSSVFTKLGIPEDSFPEEILEFAIEAKTGIPIDISFESPEN